MTTRLVMVIVLLLVLAAQGWGLVSVWREDPLRGLAVAKKKEARSQAAASGKTLSLQPMVPAVLPEFNEGYIFNAERRLAVGDGKDGQGSGAGTEGMDKVKYCGSIIAPNNIRALLSYPLSGNDSQQKLGFLRVVAGDTVNGYLVTDILPEKIIFSRRGQNITKLLYDRTREQTAGQPSPSASEVRVPAPVMSRGEQAKEPGQAQPATPNLEPGAPLPVSPGVQPPKQDGPQMRAPRNQAQPSPISPTEEELRKRPLRKRPEPPST